MKYLFYLMALSAVSCATGYLPTTDRYYDEVSELVNKHEDAILVYYGAPDEVIELSEGTKMLVYNKLPYKGAPIINGPIKQKTCRTVFQINERLEVAYIRSEGNFCVK
jgi:hypothetical protein